MITQRFIVSQKISWEKQIVGQLISSANNPNETFILWKGRLPGTPIPIHNGIGTPLSEGLLAGEEYWLERCNIVCFLEDCPKLSNIHLQNIFIEVGNILLFLHQKGLTHGEISAKRIGIKNNGQPILVGTGRKNSTFQQDIDALKSLWEEYLHSVPPNFQEELTTTQQFFHPPIPAIHSTKQEILFEVLALAPRHEHDAPDYSSTGFQTELSEITHSFRDSGEQTNAVPLQPENTTNNEAFGELLFWLSQKAPFIQITTVANSSFLQQNRPKEPLPYHSTIVPYFDQDVAPIQYEKTDTIDHAKDSTAKIDYRYYFWLGFLTTLSVFSICFWWIWRS